MKTNFCAPCFPIRMAILTNNLFFDLGVLLLTLLGVAHLYFSRNYRRWKKKGVPFLKPKPFVGNFSDVFLGKKSMGDTFQTAYNLAKGKPVIGIFAFDRPMLVVHNLDIVKSILVKDFNYFSGRHFSNDESGDLSAKTLIAMKGQPWRHLRMKLTPTFTSGKMKRMLTFIDECGKELINYVEKYSVDGHLDVKETMARFTIDVIASCVFGIQGDSLREPNSEFRRILSKVVDFSGKRAIKAILRFNFPALFSALKLKLLDSDVEEYLRNTIWSNVEYRKKNNVVRKDFFDLLLQLRETGSVEDESSNKETTTDEKKFELEGDDFVAQAFIFLAAGFETSSTTMSFALYELALQPNIQTRLRQEILSVLNTNGGELTFEGVHEMSYLDMVISETLRKYPVLPFLDRRVQRSYTLPETDIQLEKGDVVVISLTGIHYDPEYYPNPEHFDPERFTEENKRLRPNYTYMPFGEGPRICIGMRMGLLQAKVGMIHFLSHYEVSPCKDTVIPLELNKTSFLLSPKGTLPLSIRRVSVAK